MDCFSDLKARGLIYDTTDDEKVAELLNGPPIVVYAGFDPTADSLHVGNMVPLLTLARMQRYGHKPVVLAGGATGLVGDPSGKSKERNLQTAETLKHNTDCIKQQLSRFVDFSEDAPNQAVLVDNADWIGPFSYLEFLRDVGKHFSVNVMLQKESVKGRMDSGISYTEFSYMLLQAYDFLHLYRTHKCVLQCGGSDQWGNITAGSDLIRRVTGGQAWGCVQPLLTDKSGNKVGKTTDGAVWLDGAKTSAFKLYQFLVNTDDADVGNYLKFLTFVPPEEIESLPPQVAQKRLALEFTTMIHGDKAAAFAADAPKLLFGGGYLDLAEPELLAVTSSIRTELDARSTDLVEIAAHVTGSRGQSKRLLKQGGVYVNEQKRDMSSATVSADDLLFGRYLMLGLGKKKKHFLVFPSD